MGAEEHWPVVDHECVVCLRAFRAITYATLCPLCHRSLLDAGCSNYAIISWAARRARRFFKKLGRAL
jgi:hypothetical protein